MIGGATKVSGAKGFYLAMNSEALNTMVLWNSFCIGVGALGAVMKKDEKVRMNIMIIVVCAMICGSTPLAFAEGVERATLPESGDMYAFFRGSNTYKRDFDSVNGTRREQSLENCGLDTCQVTGKTELIMSLFPGSSFNVDLAESGMTVSKPMKVLVHDYSFNQGLGYEYSQYDYGIGILEGDTNQGTAGLPRDTWYTQDKFVDNVNTIIEMYGVINDKRRLPNNLRQFHYSGADESIDCGSWSSTGDHYSRQVIVPKKDGISFFTADQNVVVNGLFEIIYDGRSIFKTLEEMKEGVEVDKGLHISLADHDKPNPRNLKIFCHHAAGDRFEDCHEYNFPALGNPSSEGPGHYQVSKMLRPDQDITTSNHFFGRNDWKQQMTWYRMDGCEDGATVSRSVEDDGISRYIAEEDFKTVIETQGLKLSEVMKNLRGTTVIDLKNMEGKKVFVSNDMVQKQGKVSRSLNISPNNALFEFFGINDVEEKKRIIEACSKNGRFGFFAWIILAILAAAVIAAITVTVIWQDLKDNCCGLDRYGYNNFAAINSYALPLNQSWSAYMSEIKQTGKIINGEPVEMSVEYRNSMESRGRMMITMDKYDVALNQEQIYVLSMSVTECNAFKSGSTGSCFMNYEVVGSGGNVKFTSENCKMNNVMLPLKPGVNTLSFGINSVSFITDTLKFCVSGTSLCSTTGIIFTSSPDGSSDLLENGNPAGGLYMTFSEMFKGNALFGFTFVLSCFVTAIFLILMLIALYTLIKDYIHPEHVKKVGYMLTIFMMVSGVGSYEIYGQKTTNCAGIKEYGINCAAMKSRATNNYNEYFMGIVLDNPDMAFLNISSCSNPHFLDKTLGPTRFWKIGTCTTSASNLTNTPINTNNWNSTGYYNFNPRYQKEGLDPGTPINQDVGIMPYGDQRSLEMLVIMTLGSVYYHTVKDKWYEIIEYGGLRETVKPLDLKGCVETSWEPYDAVCTGGIETGKTARHMCWGCYGSSICAFSRGNGLNKRRNLACVNTQSLELKNTRLNMSLTDQGVWASGIYDVSQNKDTLDICKGLSLSPIMAEFCSKAKGVAVGKGGFTSGFEVKYIKVISDGINDFGFIVELLGQISFDASDIKPGNLCPVVSDLETVPGPAKCISRGFIVHCILYCEMREPARPDSDIGRAKMMINSYGKNGKNMAYEKSRGNVKRIVKELLTKSRKSARYSLLEPVSKNGRASGVDYENVFITNDGVALGIQEGGPHKVNCYFGDSSSSYCNSTMGFGWIKSVPLKPVYDGNQNSMYIPEGEVYVTFSLNGVSCTGALTDETGELVCDNDCCITSFDNFESFIYMTYGMPTRAGGSLAQSFKVGPQSRADAKVTGKVHAQGVSTEYNGTCSRGASVAMLWSCTYHFYPEIFWGVNGTTIAAAVIALGFAIWHLGLGGLFGKVKKGTKNFGGWLYKTGRGMARKVREVGGNLNIHAKLKMAEVIMMGVVDLEGEEDKLFDSERNKIEKIKSTLEMKQKKWQSEVKMPKKYDRPFTTKKREDAVGLRELNKMRSEISAIARRLKKGETVALLKKGEEFFEEINPEVDAEKNERSEFKRMKAGKKRA